MRQQFHRVGSVDFNDTPLSEVASHLNEKHGLRVRLDVDALTEEGFATDSAVTFSMRDQPLGTILKYLLRPLGCTIMIRDAAVWITTKVKAEDGDFTRIIIYDIRDLLPELSGVDTETVVDAILNSTRGPWMDIDGDGGVLCQPAEWLLVIRHTDAVHAEIARYLQSQRAAIVKTEKEQVDPEAARAKEKEVVTKYYRMEDRTAEDLLKVIPEIIEPFTWASNGFPDQKTGQIGTIRKVMTGRRSIPLPQNAIIAPQDSIPVPKQKQKPVGNKNTLNQLGGGGLGHGKANNMGTNVLIVPEAVLIIRHSNKVHRKIEKFLKELQDPKMSVPFENKNGGQGMIGGGLF